MITTVAGNVRANKRRYKRISNQPYAYEIDCADVHEIANKIKVVDDKFINEAGNDVTDECCRYLLPLIAGEASPKFINGIPDYVII